MPLTLVPDLPKQEVDGKYDFYCYQLVTLTATVNDPHAIAQGTRVYFANVGRGANLELLPTGDNWVPAPAPNQDDTVGVTLEPVAGGWQAKLVVLVAGLVPGSGTTYAYIGDRDNPSFRSSTLTFEVGPVSFVCPAYVDLSTYIEDDRSSDFWLNYAEQDQTPSHPGNNYLYYRFQATDPESHLGLPNICVRVSSSLETSGLIQRTKILLYDRYGSNAALNGDPSYDYDYVDLKTDESGVAELCLCPKGKTSSIGALAWQIGANAGSLGPFLIVDPNARWPTLSAPQTDNPVQLNDSIIDFAQIPLYENIAAGQWLFLLCNGRFQSSKRLTKTDIQNADITMPYQTSALRSSTKPYYDATKNSMIYVVYGPDIRVSSNWSFSAAGTPPEAGSDDGRDPTLPAPQLCESADGWPINALLLSKELHIRVPLDPSKIRRDDEIRIHVFLNAYRRDSDEPLGMGCIGPFNLNVSQFDIDQGFVEWPFLPQPFWGFGQARSTGDVGTLRANYDVVRGTGSEIKRAVHWSLDLVLGIDTILPNGYTGELF